MPWFHCDHLYLKRQSQEKQQVSVLSSVPSFFSLMEKRQWSRCAVLCSTFHTTQPLSLTFYFVFLRWNWWYFLVGSNTNPFQCQLAPQYCLEILLSPFSSLSVSSWYPVQHQFTLFKLLVPATTPSFLAGYLASKSTEKLCQLLIRNQRDCFLLESSLQFSFHVLLLGKLTLSYPFQFCVFTLSLSPAPYFYN